MTALSLKEFADRISAIVNGEPSLRGVWVTAETSDVRRNGGHCYLELVQKNPATGSVEAKMRANIWRSVLPGIDAAFEGAAGQRLASGMKIMACLSASFHPAYGLSLNITAVDTAYTMGDLMRRRLEILERLRREGMLTLNRELSWPAVPQRIAVISAPGAAGYGDFVHSLLTNPSHIRFVPRLFPAILQGDRCASSIIAALDEIGASASDWDCVVIIRGGGATSDLAAFEDYNLAANIAQFPLPVVVGIGHERDITVLDYVANMRVKTPTAAAEWLIDRGVSLLGRLEAIGSAIHRTATAMLAADREQLARCEQQLSHLPLSVVRDRKAALDAAALVLGSAPGRILARRAAALASMPPRLSAIVNRRIGPQMQALASLETRLRTLPASVIERRRTRLDTVKALLDVLSPQATLARGYSITRVDGRAVTSASALRPGTTLTTTLATGTVTSRVE
ncbi:MAG: exodeoxyribonuclease VII large subunit [Duncaniella sp.]|nr:exodeoxyribonuclease VII large subunit [Duncaniella sp.]